MSSSDEKPTIFFIPGAWHRPTCYDLVISPLESLSYPIETVQNPSTSAALPAKGLTEDIENVRAKLEKLIDTEGKDVVVVMHSYGGCVGTASIEALDKKTRQQEGRQGGVIALFFIAAYTIRKGENLVSASVLGDYKPRITENVCTAVSSFPRHKLLCRTDSNILCEDLFRALFFMLKMRLSSFTMTFPRPILSHMLISCSLKAV